MERKEKSIMGKNLLITGTHGVGKKPPIRRVLTNIPPDSAAMVLEDG